MAGWRASPLYQQTSTLFVTVLGSPTREELEHALSISSENATEDQKVKVVMQSPDVTYFESLALAGVKRF